MRLAHFMLCIAWLSPPALADVLFGDFSNPAGLNLEGLATTGAGRLQVCPDGVNGAGAAWFGVQQDVASAWSSEFVIQLSGGPSGLVFVVQGDDPNFLGNSGADLGYAGVSRAMAVEFDTALDLAVSDRSGNHVSVHTAGAGPVSANESDAIDSSNVLGMLDDGGLHSVRLVYVPGALSVYVDDLVVPTQQFPIDLGTDLGLSGGLAWVGFTAATGSTGQLHEVLSWSFDEQITGWNGNASPGKADITEPGVDGLIVSPFDVHLEAVGFTDPDAAAVHSCTDWEIWTMLPAERIWRTACSSGTTLQHTHLGDGVFEASHMGQAELVPLTAYTLRVRFRDDSGDVLSDWGPWDERLFQTGTANSFYPLEADDVADLPAPDWHFLASSSPVVLPMAAVPPLLALESVSGDLLYSVEGLDGLSNTEVNPAALTGHVKVRVRVDGGSAGLSLAVTDLEIVDDDCVRTRILLPEFNLAPGQTQLLWVSSDGSTWFATPAQALPNFGNLARGLAQPWVSVQPGYQVEVVATGFTLPVNIVPVPNPGPNPQDPFLYVTELYGSIKVIRKDGSVGTYASGLLNYNPTGAFPGSGEQGMAGLAIDPVSGDLFASLLYDAGGPHYPKVIRLSSTDGGQTASSIVTILDMPGESQGQSHFISHLEWLPEGALMLHMGDGFVAPTALDLDSYRGKILRLLPDGMPSSLNPMYDLGNGINSRDYIYAWGVRNPFGGARRASDGVYAMVENGPTKDRFTTLVEGRNYLWAGTDFSMTHFALYNWSPAHAPVECTFVEESVFGGSGFPLTDQGDLFVTESGPTYAPGPQTRGKRIVRFELDSSGNMLSGPTTVIEYAGTRRSTAAGIVAGPGGLYFSDLYAPNGSNPLASGANILRVRWAGQDSPCTLGTNYCEPSVANSTGEGARLVGLGSNAVVDDDLSLVASELPPNQFGYLLMSETQGLLMGPGGSQGNLCLGGTLGRFQSQLQSSGPAGMIVTSVALNNLPPPLFGGGGVMPGQSWSFQLWYRDQNPGATSNFTHGLEISFR